MTERYISNYDPEWVWVWKDDIDWIDVYLKNVEDKIEKRLNRKNHEDIEKRNKYERN